MRQRPGETTTQNDINQGIVNHATELLDIWEQGQARPPVWRALPSYTRSHNRDRAII
jgi:hypothetical protein